MLNKLAALITFCCVCVVGRAGVVADTAAAGKPGGIHAYIVNVGEGNEVYSAFGHTAIRMVYPNAGLDYCFTFEMDMRHSSYVDFLRHRAKAGFTVVPTQKFLRGYSDEGRMVEQYELNLTDTQKRQMWRTLDAEIKRGATWTFDYYTINCTSMTLYVIMKSLGDSKMTFTALPPCMHGTYNDVLEYMSENSPWMRIFWRTVLFDKINTHGDATEMISPKILAETLPSVMITDSAGVRRRLMAEDGRHSLSEAKVNPAPFWLTPVKAGITLAIMALMLICRFIVVKAFTNKHKKLSV